MSMFHKDAPVGDIHIIHQWTYADATARAAASGFASSDVGKVALQLDTSTYYILTDESPITWQKIGSATQADIDTHVNDTTDAHAGSAITNTPSGNLAATTVQAALNELQSDVDTRATSATVTAHTSASTGVHGVTGSVMGTTDTQSFSNKTATDALTFTQIATPSSPAAGKNKIYPKSDGYFYTLDSSGNEVKVGSGSGGGLNLLILDSAYAANNGNDADFESTVGRWTQYADAAATTPVDMTGGSPGSTAPARSTSSPLNGTASMVWDLGTGSSRQGEGMVLGPVYVPPGYRGRNVQGSAVFEVTGSIVDGDLVPFVYDITNSTLITPYVSGKILGSSGKLQFNFSIPSTCAQLRIGIHCARTSTGALSIKTDDWKLTDEVVPVGLAGSNWVSYSPTITGSVSNPTEGTGVTKTAYWRRVGDSVEVEFTYEQTGAGASGSGQYIFPLPTGLSIDTSKIKVSTNYYQGNALGAAYIQSTTSGAQFGYVFAYSASGFALSNVAGSGTVGSGFNDLGQATIRYTFTARVPVVGWDSNVTMANSSTYKISSYLANGSRVTGSAPTALGQYRSYLRNAGATTYTETNGSPTTTPTVADGIKLYQGNGSASADTNSEPSRYEIFVGKNKTVGWEFYSSTGRTGGVSVNFVDDSTANQSVGCVYGYDPTTGIASIVNPGFRTTQRIGSSTTGTGGLNQDIYFDIVVSENALAVGVDMLYSRQVVVGTAQTSNGTLTSGSYTNFTNQPSVTIVPTKTKQYKVSLAAPMSAGTVNATVDVRINNSVGSATTVFSQEMSFTQSATLGNYYPVYLYAIYSLTAGTSYTFTLQGRADSSATATIHSARPSNGVAMVVEEWN